MDSNCSVTFLGGFIDYKMASKMAVADPEGLKQYFRLRRARCSSVVRAFAHGEMACQIDPSGWTHSAISRSRQCYTTGVSKAVVCVILSVGWCI